MIIGSNSFNNLSSSYIIKINEEESLEVRKEKVVDNPNKKRIEEEKELESTKDVKSDGSKELSEGEEQLVDDLSQRDAEVRSHEAAHQAAGGGLTGAASYSYQQGPDGKMYAIGGEVSISMKSGSTPQETIANARQIAAAAMAAGDPSPQDYSVASSARIMEMKAQQQLSKEMQEETLGKDIYSNISATDKNEEISVSSEPFDISA